MLGVWQDPSVAHNSIIESELHKEESHMTHGHGKRNTEILFNKAIAPFEGV